MPLLPDIGHIELIRDECLNAFDRGESLGAMELADRLMKIDGLPMHCPYHHFLVPAALLTSAHIRCGSPRGMLVRDLDKARDRSKDIPGGICGLCGCCGAAVGTGIFVSVWLGTSPMSKGKWALANAVTARALSAIASVDGPRCCKRVSFLSLRAAVPAIKELLDIDLGGTEMLCSYHDFSRECKKDECPFYPG